MALEIADLDPASKFSIHRCKVSNWEGGREIIRDKRIIFFFFIELKFFRKFFFKNFSRFFSCFNESAIKKNFFYVDRYLSDKTNVVRS